MTGLVLREAQLEDFEHYFKIKSDPENVKWSGFQNPPPYQALEVRYKAFFEDKDQALLLFEANGVVVGYVNLHLVLDEQAVETSHGSLFNHGISGLGVKMLRMTVKYIEDNDIYPDAKNMLGWVAEDNIASLQNILRNGYKSTGESDTRIIDGKPKVFKKYLKELNSNE